MQWRIDGEAASEIAVKCLWQVAERRQCGRDVAVGQCQDSTAGGAKSGIKSGVEKVVPSIRSALGVSPRARIRRR
eukprot:6181359-Pleurochrysis_carterae.AAC.1